MCSAAAAAAVATATIHFSGLFIVLIIASGCAPFCHRSEGGAFTPLQSTFQSPLLLVRVSLAAQSNSSRRLSVWQEMRWREDDVLLLLVRCRRCSGFAQFNECN